MTTNLPPFQRYDKSVSYKEYAERYLRHVYELGYPAEKDRHEFLKNFHQNNPRGSPGNIHKSPLRNVVYDFHRSLQHGIIPVWARDPMLHPLFAKVLTDFKEKYQKKDVKFSISAQDNNTLEFEHISDYEPEESRELETDMVFQAGQGREAAYIGTEGSKSENIFSKPTTKQTGMKQDVESDDEPVFLGITTVGSVVNELRTISQLEQEKHNLIDDWKRKHNEVLKKPEDEHKRLTMKIVQMEKEPEMMGTLKQLQEKNNEIEYWKRKHDEMMKKNEEEQKNLSMKIAQMEEEHKAEKMKLLDDKMKVMAQLLEEKDRNIQLLSI